ncbi:MAG TPA: Calx-beta domain-containing protein, partial [Candidatus Dormibacteraeota bacterium]|nr:Calx-beta domain-containing protein [Candidatus Dormibacteraeota bacterium]
MKRFFAGLTIIAVFCLGALLVGRRPEGGIKEQTSSPPTPTSSNLANAIRSASNAAAPLLNPVLTNKLPAAERSAPFPAIDAFSTWADQYLSPTGAVSLVRGQELAWKRRQAMAELIESNPEQAIAMAVPFAWRAALPANVTKYFETRLDGRGDFNVGVATDFEHGTTAIYREARLKGKRYTAFVFGARNNQSSQTNIPLHGIELGGRVALQPEPIRILEAAESEALVKESGQPVDPICAVSGNPANSRNQPVAAEIGGEVRYFCGLDHIRLLNQKPALAASGGVGGTNTFSTPANDAWTHGPKALLYMRVNFPDDLTEPISEAQAYNVMDGVNDFYTTGSYDLTALTATVTPLITLPQTKNYYSSFGPGSLLDDARETVRRNGYDTANYDRDIVCFTSVPGYTFGGLAFVHGKGVWLQSTGVGVTSHELGHNYGLWHANAWNPTNLSVIGPGTNNEYGNIFDTMGSGGVAQFNSAHKNLLDWLPTEDVHNAASNGVYRIYPFDVPNRVNGRAYAAFVRKDSLRDYWIEFRESYTANRWLQNGVLLDWSPWLESNGGTHLLDTTPGTPNGLDDAAVVIGRTFTDPGAGVHITPVGKGATGTNAWIEVQVNHGGPTNNQPPSLSLQIEFTNAAPGQVVHFHAAATDPDGDTLAYAFSFDDSTFSTNNLPWTYKSWSTPGNHVVRCVVSDMKGGVASANGIVRVGNPSGFSIRGQILNADGNPIEGVRVDNTLTNGTYYGGYTDSDGSYVITGASGDLPLYPVLHGFTFTNITWTNPVSATADVLHADFIASPLPQVNIVSSTNAVPENSTGSNYFLLTRTGDPITNLTLTIYLSGSATVGNDYTLNPPLVAGSNSIDIPPGEQSLAISFTPINDSLVEGPESVTIMVMEDPAYLYVPAYPSEAAITILDDDSPTKPAVSITAVTPTVPENGIDKATFQVSRNGSAQGDLMVFYTVSGTATPGQDYTSLVGGVLIPSGSSSALVQFQPIDDKLVEGDETVIVSLSSNPAYTPGSSSSDQIKILDDDLLTVTISPTSDSAAEPSNPGRFTV